MKTRTIAAVIVPVAFIAAAGTASAGISGASDAHALSARVDLVGGVISLNAGPFAATSGIAPDIYDNDQTVLTASVSAAIVGSVNTGVLTSRSQSSIGFTSWNGGVYAEAGVDDLEVEIVPGILLTPDLVNLSADTITSFATLTSTGGVVTPFGGSTLENATLSIGGVGNLVIPLNPAANTVLLDAAGIRVVLNEQIFSTMGDTTTLDVNAIHITINGALNVVDADITIAHSSASMTVPTPGSAALLGLAGLAATRRRRNP